jgi:hypothetical protein
VPDHILNVQGLLQRPLSSAVELASAVALVGDAAMLRRCKVKAGVEEAEAVYRAKVGAFNGFELHGRLSFSL